MRFEVTKRYDDLTFTHRAHNHDGHCRNVHGHCASVEVTFSALKKDGDGFVVDFGKMKWVNEFITELMDHTLLINEDDPYVGDFKKFNGVFRCFDIRVVPSNSCEGMAKYLFEQIDKRIPGNILDATARQVRVERLCFYEDSRNYSTYMPISR